MWKGGGGEDLGKRTTFVIKRTILTISAAGCSTTFLPPNEKVIVFILSSSLKLSLFELQLSNSDFEDRFKFVRESSSTWRMNHWNPTKIYQTGANYGFVLWKQCIQSCPQKTVSSLYLLANRKENCLIILISVQNQILTAAAWSALFSKYRTKILENPLLSIPFLFVSTI